jgi:DNA-binding YbaB/EbfC family protein
MKGGLGQMMKQAQKMQADMEKAQQELADMEVLGESGGGMVKVTMTCKHQMRKIDIEPALLHDDKEMLEDLIAAACNDAVGKVERTVQEKLAGLTSGMGLPAGLKLPF